MRPKDTQMSLTLSLLMNKQTLISLLKQGNTGNEILEILEALAADEMSTESVEDEIQF